MNPTVDQAIALVDYIAHLGGGVDASLLPGMAFDLSLDLYVLDSLDRKRALPKQIRDRLARIVSGVEGLLGESLVDVLERELKQIKDERAAQRRRSALSYLKGDQK